MRGWGHGGGGDNRSFTHGSALSPPIGAEEVAACVGTSRPMITGVHKRQAKALIYVCFERERERERARGRERERERKREREK